MSHQLYYRLSIAFLGAMLAINATYGATPEKDNSDDNSSLTTISLWNGNKTQSRQVYEREVLEAALAATRSTHGRWELREDLTDYPRAEDEANIFAKGIDIFGTVAGNPKFAVKKKIMVPHPIMKGILGYRLLIIRKADSEQFSAVKSAEGLRRLRMGIPATWADAALFRHNGYTVVEKGSFDELFQRLENNEFDYVTFGANEIADVFATRAAQSGELIVEPSLVVYYPFPLVFYVNPDNSALAERVRTGLEIIIGDGELDRLFNRHYGVQLTKLALRTRTRITLKNPLLPTELSNFKPSL